MEGLDTHSRSQYSQCIRNLRIHNLRIRSRNNQDITRPRHLLDLRRDTSNNRPGRRTPQPGKACRKLIAA